ncbi:MAG TPA: 3'-5' exonuclease [Phycisphaerales bacterium]|nr:3'-5' exonuclease [Phycisphaerales bacterium]
MSKLLAFDLEATGLDTGNDRIVEFCFLSLDDNLEVSGRYQSLVNPGVPIPAESTEIHGITDQDVAQALPFASHARRIQALVDQCILVAHNGIFDMALLNAELQRAGEKGISPTHPLIDTLAIERYVNSHKLEDAYKRYEGKGFEDAHRAEADTRATVAVLRGQLRVHGDRLPESLEGLVAQEIQSLAGYEFKEYLDHDHRFYRDAEGVIRFNFGQHRGDDVADRRGYLEWMLRREFSNDTLNVVKQLLKR